MSIYTTTSFNLQLNDPMGEATAKMNIADLRKVLNLPESPDSGSGENSKTSPQTPQTDFGPCHQRIQRVRRESMEQLDLIKVVVGLCFFLFCDWFLVLEICINLVRTAKVYITYFI